MTEESPEPESPVRATSPAPKALTEGGRSPGANLLRRLEPLVISLAALLAAMLLFGLFLACDGLNPIEVYGQMFRGAFGTWFSFQNTLQRAAPLMLTALCTALPAQLGLVVIGGEGALVIGGLAAAVTGLAVHDSSPYAVLTSMFIAGAVAGGIWIALIGALRAYRGVNETISSLLMAYIAIALLNHLVEGPLRDPASLNKPATRHIGDANMLGSMPGLDVHWGLFYGIVACLLAWVLMKRTVFGFAAAMTGGNVRAALLSGLRVKRLTILACFLAGAAAGLAGMVEVAAVHGRANASLVAGYGYTGILVAFVARQNPLGVIPVALLLGGIGASGGLLQRNFNLPDASVNVLQGILFMVILAAETLYGRLDVWAFARRPSVEKAVSAGAVA
ncbi:MAG TPA: ABC transporter permease [Polyangiaceae bacterium]|jgi:simple sugar transport system permease protein|nr:ABC transporter permease [Polyangiaceae bacterium]